MLVRFADVIAIPYPIVLVAAGLGIGFVPGVEPVELDPEVIFLVFLPPLLHAAGYYSSPQELRAELAPLSGLVVGLAVLTAGAVAVVAHFVVPGLGWGEALLLGAIVAPTDPVAATATFERVGAPERVSLLVEGESLLNDATALVAYRVLVAGVVAGAYSAGNVAEELTIGVVGGVGIGLVFGWLVVRAQRRLDDPPLAILLSLVTPYVAYLACEEIGASGVLAVVASGLYLGWHSHEAFDADTRLGAQAFWRALVFALNAILFILLGLQFPELLEEAGRDFAAGELIAYALAVAGTVIVVRIAWQLASPLVPALDTGADWRERLVVGWSGMRGAVSLAAALALPLTLDGGVPFAERELIIFLTVATILATLVLQGLTLPMLIRRLGVSGERPWAPDEAIARLHAAQAALDRLDELETHEVAAGHLSEEMVERLRELYRARFERCMSAISGDDDDPAPENPLRAARLLRIDLIEVERRALLTERNAGRLRADVLRRIERELDLDEARLRR